MKEEGPQLESLTHRLAELEGESLRAAEGSRGRADVQEIASRSVPPPMNFILLPPHLGQTAWGSCPAPHQWQRSVDSPL